ncbi:MAG: hypothetical protein ABI433_00225 [Burkholderiaceae bacterium]
MPAVGSVYPRGHFFQQLAGAHQPSATDMVSNRVYFGLQLSATFLYGCLRTEDGEMIEIVRRFSHHENKAQAAAGEESLDSPPAFLLVQTTEIDHQNLRFDMPRMQAAAVTNNARIYLDGKEAVWKPADGTRGKPFEIRFSEEACSWVEQGLWTLKGRLVKPGLHWYLPGRDYGTYYVSQIFEVEGEYEGRRVRGMVGFDQTYMGEGGDLYKTKDLVLENKAHIVWYTWGTRYKDGTVEAGHFMLGHDRMGFAVFTDGANVTATQAIDGRVFPKEGGKFADRIELTIDGVAWEFLPDPRGCMPDMLRKHPPTPQQEGRWRRVGDTREPDVWFAWGETEPDHGFERQRKLPTFK